MSLLRALHVRLTIVFFIFLSLLGAFTLWFAEQSATLRSLEFTQRLNQPIAMYMAQRAPLANADGLLGEVLAELAPHVMMINPSIEVYLLDTDGRVVAQASTANSIGERRVSLEPIRRFLAGNAPMPLLGDNPLNDERRVFSAWPVMHEGELSGYVYAVLAGEQHVTLLDALGESHAARELVATLLGVMLLAALAGAVVFFTLTRRLRALTARVERGPTVMEAAGPRALDEIDELACAYECLTERLHAQYAELEANDASRRDLVASVSHDLRTPLTILQGYLETLMLRDERLTPAERRHYLDIAHRHAESLRRRVAELFELSRLSAVGVELHRERFSLLELAHDSLQDFQLLADEKCIELAVRRSDGGTQGDSYELEADIALIQRVFENLVANAIRHTGTGGHITIRLARNDDRGIRVDVRDDGCGMTPEVASRIFEPCFSHGVTDDTHGGLGLAIVARVVELHAGRLSVSSRPGFGTRFRIDLPCPAP